jgi:hypothetical protein
MNYLILYFIIICIIILYFSFNKEGFNPYHQDERPFDYPDQTKNGNLVEIGKYIYSIIDSNNVSNEQKMHLEELLNLIQFI